MIICIFLFLLSSCCNFYTNKMNPKEDKHIGEYRIYEFVGFTQFLPINISGLLIFKDDNDEYCFLPTEEAMIFYTTDSPILDVQCLYVDDSSERVIVDTTRDIYNPDPILITIANHPDFERLQVGKKYNLLFYKYDVCQIHPVSMYNIPASKIDTNIEVDDHYFIKNKKIVEQVYQCNQIYSVFVAKTARID